VPFEDKGGTGRAATTRTSLSTARARGHRRRAERILLTLATGTGKTFIAFQIAWKLFRAAGT
jgi:type I restriction enzyme R subunit